MPDAPAATVTLDVAVIGGGIAGLWLLNRLLDAGYRAALLEAQALGSDQTVASQGMIHGGIKYTLKGALTGASEAIAGMPARWRTCLAGEGELDLRGTPILSEHFYLFSSGGLSSRVGTFLASRVTRGRVQPVAKGEAPTLFQHQGFRGRLYRLEDLVLDVPGLLARLADRARGHVFLAPPADLRLQRDSQGQTIIQLTTVDGPLRVQAHQVVLTAGKGNADLLAQLNLGQSAPAMQLRPLHQVMVEHRHPYPFYGHCLGTGTTPRLTISSHPGGDGRQVWYLGGALAETGVGLDSDAQIQRAKAEVADLFPQLDWAHARWATLRVDRVEPKQATLTRPDHAFAAPVPGGDNLTVAWPTKLTLVPDLADRVLAPLPAPDTQLTDDGLTLLRARLFSPPLAATPWATAFGGFSC